MTDDDELKNFDIPATDHVAGLFGKCSCGDDHTRPRGFVAEMVMDAPAPKVKVNSSLRQALRTQAADSDFKLKF